MRRPKAMMIICLLLIFCCSHAIPAAAASTTGAGSLADPLVSQAWVDNRLENTFYPLEMELAALRSRIGGTTIILTIGSSTYTVNDELREMDTAPYINSNLRTMIPIRFVAEGLGAQVEWIPPDGNQPGQVLINSEGNSIIINIGSVSYMVNDQPMTMDTVAVINDSRTMVPVRFVAEGLGAQVDWSPKVTSVENVYIYK